MTDMTVMRAKKFPAGMIIGGFAWDFAGPRQSPKPWSGLGLVFALAACGCLAARIAELVGLGKTLGRKTAGVGAVAAPIGKLFER